MREKGEKKKKKEERKRKKKCQISCGRTISGYVFNKRMTIVSYVRKIFFHGVIVSFTNAKVA